MTISATFHIDDGVGSHTVDAAPWFRQATAPTLVGLFEARNGLTSSTDGDLVAEWLADNGAEGLKKLFAACEVLDKGFHFDINEVDAENWLRGNRPEVYDYLVRTGKIVE